MQGKPLVRGVQVWDSNRPLPRPAVPFCPHLTCYEVVDNGVGALIRVHRPGDIAHHRAGLRVLRDGERLVLGTVPLPEHGKREGRVTAARELWGAFF